MKLLENGVSRMMEQMCSTSQIPNGKSGGDGDDAKGSRAARRFSNFLLQHVPYCLISSNPVGLPSYIPVKRRLNPASFKDCYSSSSIKPPTVPYNPQSIMTTPSPYTRTLADNQPSALLANTPPSHPRPPARPTKLSTVPFRRR